MSLMFFGFSYDTMYPFRSRHIPVLTQLTTIDFNMDVLAYHLIKGSIENASY